MNSDGPSAAKPAESLRRKTKLSWLVVQIAGKPLRGFGELWAASRNGDSAKRRPLGAFALEHLRSSVHRSYFTEYRLLIVA